MTWQEMYDLYGGAGQGDTGGGGFAGPPPPAYTPGTPPGAPPAESAPADGTAGTTPAPAPPPTTGTGTQPPSPDQTPGPQPLPTGGNPFPAPSPMEMAGLYSHEITPQGVVTGERYTGGMNRHANPAREGLGGRNLLGTKYGNQRPGLTGGGLGQEENDSTLATLLRLLGADASV